MIRRILFSQSKTITGAALVLGAASFVSRIIGLGRDRIFAHTFGAGQTLDVYYAAFRIPDLLYNIIIVGALSAGFIPVFLTLWNKNKEEAQELFNQLITVALVVLTGLSIILFICMPWLVRLIVPGFGEEAMVQTTALSRIMLLSPIILGVSGIVSGVLQALKSFFIYSITPIVYNIGIIIGAIFFVPVWGISGLGYGVILGTLLHLAIQLPPLLRYGFVYRPSTKLNTESLKSIGRLMIPRTLTLGTNQLTFVIITVIASTLGAGSIAIFNLANNLQYFPVGIIGISFALAAFPTLSELVAQKNEERFREELSSTIRQIIFLIVPLTILFLLLRAQIVRTLLGSGKFDWDATIATANTLAFFSLSLFAQSLIPLLTRGFYALHNTKTPLFVAFISTLITIILSLSLKETFGIVGLAMAFSLGCIFQTAVLWVTLRNHIKTLHEGKMLHSLYKISIAGVVMALAIQLSKGPIASVVNMQRFWGIFIQGLVTGIIGVVVYGLICYLLRTEEMLHLLRTLNRRWLTLRGVVGEVNKGDELAG